MRIGIRIGQPLDFSRYEGMEDDRFVLRSITDEIMYELMLLSGQEYVDDVRHVDEGPHRRAPPRSKRPRAPGGRPARAAPPRSSRRRSTPPRVSRRLDTPRATREDVEGRRGSPLDDVPIGDDDDEDDVAELRTPGDPGERAAS